MSNRVDFHNPSKNKMRRFLAKKWEYETKKKEKNKG
jgi:hypothetical protein